MYYDYIADRGLGEFFFHVSQIDMYRHRKCGNNKCKSIYLKDRYGLPSESVNCETDQGTSMINAGIETRYLMRLLFGYRKWKLCKGCKTTYYCSRKCQKISWKQGHKQQCQTLEKLLASM